MRRADAADPIPARGREALGADAVGADRPNPGDDNACAITTCWHDATVYARSGRIVRAVTASASDSRSVTPTSGSAFRVGGLGEPPFPRPPNIRPTDACMSIMRLISVGVRK